MDPKAMENLRLDRRLATRRDWIKPEDLEKELAALPDVSDKVQQGDAESEADSEATPEA